MKLRRRRSEDRHLSYALLYYSYRFFGMVLLFRGKTTTFILVSFFLLSGCYKPRNRERRADAFPSDVVPINSPIKIHCPRPTRVLWLRVSSAVVFYCSRDSSSRAVLLRSNCCLRWYSTMIECSIYRKKSISSWPVYGQRRDTGLPRPQYTTRKVGARMESTGTEGENKWAVHARFRHHWSVYVWIVSCMHALCSVFQ